MLAHAATAEHLLELAALDRSDAALDRRVAAGKASPRHGASVKEELPSPRAVEVAPAVIVFECMLEVELRGATARVRHVGGDHSADGC